MLMTSTTPHIFSPVTTRRLMWDVIIALLPAAVASVLIFGISALQVLITSIALTKHHTKATYKGKCFTRLTVLGSYCS